MKKSLICVVLCALLLLANALAEQEQVRENVLKAARWMIDQIQRAQQPDPYFWIFECETTADPQDVAQIAQTLKDLGITDISPEAEAAVRAWIEGMAEYGFEPQESRESIALSLLFGAGLGEFDEENWRFVPTSSNVYAFDLEVMDVATMYETFLMGVQAIGGGELIFTDISETMDETYLEAGYGSREVSFCLNGEPYVLTATDNSDWFDMNMLNAILEIVNARESERKLYFVLDGYQCCVRFYNTPEWAGRFTRETGCPLFIEL